MQKERKATYDRLRSFIGGTPLTEMTSLQSEAGGRIFLKHEFRNPTGSHYDRIMIESLYRREDRQDIAEGDVLLDTTTGNSGASLAWLAQVLGYGARIIIPKDAPRARIAQIASLGGAVEFSAPHRYTDGLIEALKHKIRDRPWPDFDEVLDHASDVVAPPHAMRALGKEVRDQFAEQWPDERITHLVVALGNGASVHMAATLCDEDCTVVGFEPIQAPTHFLEKYSATEFQRRYGDEPVFSLDHGLWGTGAGIDLKFKWPLMKRAWDLLDDIHLVRQEEWEQQCIAISAGEGLLVGRSTGAGVAVARKIVAEAEDPVNVMCIAYDPAWKYL